MRPSVQRWRQQFITLLDFQWRQQALVNGHQHRPVRNLIKCPGMDIVSHRRCQLVVPCTIITMRFHRRLPHTINRNLWLIITVNPKVGDLLVQATSMKTPIGQSISTYCISSYSISDIAMSRRVMVLVPIMKDCISGVLIKGLSTRKCVATLAVEKGAA